ncbi:MAG: YfhO family protein [Candidatus Omnitrophota bacterium]
MKNNFFITMLLFALAAIIFSHSIFENNELFGQKDWDQFIMWNAVPHKTILTYHQFPLWNPYVNGGNVMLAHPHSPFLSPFFIFVLFFGPIMGLKIQITVHLFLGFCGMYILTKHLGVRGMGGYLSSFIFMGSSLFSLHLTEGHTEWLAMAFVPWFFLFYLKSLEESKNILGGIIFLSLILLNGSVDVFNIMMVFIVLFAFLKSIQMRQWFPVKSLGVILAGTFLFCAVKLIPMLDFIGHNPRVMSDDSAVSINVLFHMLLNPDQSILDMMNWLDGYRMGLVYEWHEYGAYVGYIPLILCMWGTIKFFEKQWPLICSGLITFIIAMGNSPLLNLWSMLHKFPVYDSLTVPSRFILGFIFYLSIIAGMTFYAFDQYMQKKSNQHKNYLFVIPMALFMLVTYDLYESNSSVFQNAFRVESVQLRENIIFAQRYREVLFYEDYLVNSSIYPVFLSNGGIIEAYEVMQLKQGDVKVMGEPDYRGEFYLDRPYGEIDQEYFSPNEQRFSVNLNEANLLMINQNYHQGWKAEVAGKKTPVTEIHGLISVLLPPGTYQIRLYYLPETFIIGLIVTALTICLAVINLVKNQAVPFLSKPEILQEQN